MVELCQRVLDGKGMPDQWQTSVLVPIFKKKGDVRNCNTYRGVKLLEHAMKIVERVVERRTNSFVHSLTGTLHLRYGWNPRTKVITCAMRVMCAKKFVIE